jgi:hypothetical protein
MEKLTNLSAKSPPKPVFATECDLIMKGGITSGIIYPHAIAEIAKGFTRLHVRRLQ